MEIAKGWLAPGFEEVRAAFEENFARSAQP